VIDQPGRGKKQQPDGKGDGKSKESAFVSPGEPEEKKKRKKGSVSQKKRSE